MDYFLGAYIDVFHVFDYTKCFMSESASFFVSNAMLSNVIFYIR